MKIYLSVVIPAYNEADNIKRGVLDQVYKYLTKQKYSWEVLVVDDGSSDSTTNLVEKFVNSHSGFKLLKEPHRGKAGTIVSGILATKGEIVLFTDMDQSTPIDQIEKFLPKFKEGYDVVIGSRTGREGAPPIRKLMAVGFSMLRLIILRLPYKDTQCGFKAFKYQAARDIFKKLKTLKDKEIKGAAVFAGFDIEILYVARKLGLKVFECPVYWKHFGTVRVSPIKDSIQALTDLIRVRMNALLGKYK